MSINTRADAGTAPGEQSSSAREEQRPLIARCGVALMKQKTRMANMLGLILLIVGLVLVGAAIAAFIFSKF